MEKLTIAEIASLITIGLGILVPLLGVAGAGWMAKIQLDIRFVKQTVLTDIKLIKQAMTNDRQTARSLRGKVRKHSEKIEGHQEKIIEHGVRLDHVEKKVDKSPEPKTKPSERSPQT